MENFRELPGMLIHIQSEHSLGRASISLRELFQRAAAMNVKKVIITEYHTLASTLEAFDLMQEFGISASMGLEVNLHWRRRGISTEGTLLLLPKDEEGIYAIGKALSESYQKKQDRGSWFDAALLERWFAPGAYGHGHVIATTGGQEGVLYQLLKKIPQAQSDLRDLQWRKTKLIDPTSTEAYKTQQSGVQVQISADTGKKQAQKAAKARKQAKEWDELISEEKRLKRFVQSVDVYQSKVAQLSRDLSVLFGEENYYVELVCHWTALDQEVLPLLVRIADEQNLLIADEVRVANNTKEAHRRQQLIEAIGTGGESGNGRQGDFYIRPLKDIVCRLQKILPFGTIQRGLEGREKCCDACWLIQLSDKPHYPVFRDEDANIRLLRLVEKGIQKRFPKKRGWDSTYEQRLQNEMQIIEQTGFADYFCIVEDIIRYAKELEKKEPKGAYYVGPGRGSAVGSLVCYLLGITTIDPIKENLLFSRFLNISRTTAPDIDTDIAPQIYDRVIAYAKEKYGDRAISAISTKMRMGAMQSLDYACAHHKASQQLIQTMKNCVKDSAGDSLQNAKELHEFAKKNRKAAKILADAELLEGRRIGIGQHPSGLVLSDVPDISDRTPILFNVRTGNWMTQMDMDEIERQGMLKIDLLKLRTLDVITETLQMIDKPIHPDKIPVEKEVFKEVFSKGQTVGVFQVESAGMQNLLRQLKPENLEDLSLLISIYRPGPLQYADQIIQAKLHRIKKRASTKLNAILHGSYGYTVYQEQLMSIFHEIGGLTLPEADKVRRAITKKNSSALEPYRPRLLDGLIREGMSESQAKHFWTELLEFGHYTFNRSHAVAYAKLAYITGYLKHHYPREYLCALLNHSDKNRIPVFVAECRRRHISILPPDVYSSGYSFHLSGSNGIRFGLRGIKGMSFTAIEKLLTARREHPFHSMKDFLDRAHEDNRCTDLLIRAGAMDSWTNNRRQLLQWYPKVSQWINDFKKELNRNGESLAAAVYRRRFYTSVLPVTPPHTLAQAMEDEVLTLGCCLSVDPLEAYRNILREDPHIQSVADTTLGDNTLFGIIENLRVLKRKKDGREFAVFTLKDDIREIEAACFSDVYEQVKENICEGAAVKVSGIYKDDAGEQKLIIRNANRLEPQYDSLTISLPNVLKWVEIQSLIRMYMMPVGTELIIQDRTSGHMYRAPFAVSEQIRMLEWDQDCYLLNPDVNPDKNDLMSNEKHLGKQTKAA